MILWKIHMCWLGILLVCYHPIPGRCDGIRPIEDSQVYRAGLLFQDTVHQMQMIEDTHIVKVPFSMKPLEESVEFVEKFGVRITGRLDLIGRTYSEFLGRTIIFNKTIMGDRKMEAMNRTVQVMHDLLETRHEGMNDPEGVVLHHARKTAPRGVV